MASKKKGQISRHCRIFQWIESQDSDLAGAIRDLCLEGSLSPGGRAGITFLYPKDKSYRSEIVDKAYSDEADEAVKIIESLIIPDVFAHGSDFARRPVGNKLGVKFDVESADASRVKLAKGVELERVSDFNPLQSKAERIAVWAVAAGRVPMRGEKYVPPVHESRSRKQGGAAAASAGNNLGLTRRQLLAINTEDAFNTCMMSQAQCRVNNPYLGRVVGLLNWLKVNHADLYVAVLPILDWDPVVTFYLLFEPYKTAGEFLIPTEILYGNNAWNECAAFTDAVVDFKSYFDSLPTQADDSATEENSGTTVVPFVFRDRASVSAAIDLKRMEYNSLNPLEGPQNVMASYAALIDNNKIGGLNTVLPDYTRKIISSSKKLWQDEFRFIVHEALLSVRHHYEPDTFRGLVEDLRFRFPGNDYGNELMLSNISMNNTISPKIEFSLLTKFVNSTAFLYAACSSSMVGEPNGSLNHKDWRNVYNVSASAKQGFQSTETMVQPAGIGRDTLEALKTYVSMYGHLPSEVLALQPNTSRGFADAAHQ